MDFVVELGKKDYSALILGKTKILERLFELFKEDSYGLVSNNLVVIGALIYS